MHRLKNGMIGSAIIGTVGWGLYLLLDPEPLLAGLLWIERLFLMAPLIIVPLALHLLLQLEPQWEMKRATTGLLLLQPVAALVLAGSFLLNPGGGVVLLTLPWLAFCFLLPAFGLWRLIEGGLTFERIIRLVGMGFLAVGGGWVLINRMGTGFMGFRYPIPLLTGVHFHFTGFATTVLVTGLCRYFDQKTNRTGRFLARLTGTGIVVGMPLVAAGFVYSEGLKTVGVLMLVLVIVLVAGLLVLVTFQTDHRAVRWFALLSAMAGIAGMALAAIYQITLHAGDPWITIRTMTITHGVLNSVGFLLFGLIGLCSIYSSNRCEQ